MAESGSCTDQGDVDHPGAFAGGLEHPGGDVRIIRHPACLHHFDRQQGAFPADAGDANPIIPAPDSQRLVYAAAQDSADVIELYLTQEGYGVYLPGVARP